MSLDYNLTKVENWRDLEWDTVQYVIFVTMIVGLGEITETNAAKFYTRLRAYERVTDKPIHTTPADIRSLIGLHTNVFPAESDTKFARKLLAWATDAAAGEWNTNT